MIKFIPIMSDYSSERELVNGFLENLRRDRTPWHCVHVSTEFFYQRGRTDVIVLDIAGNVIAFEAKLNNWRVALQQAYRNTCFANFSYVVLPKSVALLASRSSAEFDRRRVGICYFDGNETHILQEAGAVDPVQPWLCTRAIECMSER
jgi:hypothetical protein